MKLKLIQTCGACPEQYDAFTEDGQKIGYLRLRHGYFFVDYLPSSQTIYDAYPRGDGCFESDERDYYLGEACDALIRYHQDEPKVVKDIFYF